MIHISIWYQYQYHEYNLKVSYPTLIELHG